MARCSGVKLKLMELLNANETNIVNKDSPIDSLTLIIQTTTTSTTNHTQAAITVSYLSLESSLSTFRNISLG